MRWVLDCSFVATLGLPDEHSPAVEEFFQREASHAELWVPALWWYELSNVLLVAQRRQRIQQAQRVALQMRFAALPLQTDGWTGEPLASRIQNLGEEYGLSAYDATYLELAQRKDAGLASFDKALIAAAKRSGVECYAPA